MAYSDQTKVQTRAKALADATGEDLAKIASGIAWADSVIDARLAARYGSSLPFSPVPAIIAEISADLAAYEAVRAIHMAGGEDMPVEGAKELRDRAYLLLADLQNGKILLPIDSGAEASSLPPCSTLSNNSEAGVLRGFDLQNTPAYPQSCLPPFAPRRFRGGGW